MALDDYLPEEEAERALGKGAIAACLARRDSYDVDAFAWTPHGESDAGEEEADHDGGSSAGADAGYDSSTAQPGMPRNPPVIYVAINLIVEACDFGESPPVDVGALYAIDTVNWRVLAIHH